jgi:hypothetical protein
MTFKIVSQLQPVTYEYNRKYPVAIRLQAGKALFLSFMMPLVILMNLKLD